MSDIVWEAPPPPKTGHSTTEGVWGRRLAPLRDRPGEWANLGERSSAAATMINRGLFVGIERGEFEAVGRNQNNGRCTLYVRYIGGEA